MFTLPALPYKFSDFEPHIDALTMEIHHDKHHQAYVDNLNKALEGTEFAEWTLDKVMTGLDKLPADKQMAVRNHGGGHYNHSLFWTLFSVRGGEVPTGELLTEINKYFGSVADFQTQFTEAAMKRFGSGWAWLVKTNDGKLVITSTANQDNPLMPMAEVKGTPILALDVWEHAYYLNYQNRRADYIKAWWNVVDWDEVAKLLAA